MNKILNRHTGNVIASGNKTVRELAIEHKANLSRADLRGANLSYADLSYADLSYANLSYANLSYANLSGADLSGANLSRADLSGANLSGADLSRANLRGADLSYANLSYADLSGADLSYADLSYANLIRADLSGCKGIKTASAFLKKFKTDELGLIVYKGFGDTTYETPDSWKIEPGSFITETVNPLPTLECACGVNFGTKKFVKESYPHSTIWKCRIRYIDLADVVVPYRTDGKARCARLELLEVVK